MSTSLLRLAQLTGLAASTLILSNAQAMPAPEQTTDQTARFVYIESNLATAGKNSVLGFQRATDGQLTPIAGSPFLTGGQGVVDPTYALGPFDSDQNIALSQDHRFLFAVNSGSNTIAVFKIMSTGALKAIAGSPFASHGVNPVSVGVEKNLLVVVNKSGDPAQASDKTLPNYTNFWIKPDGSLQHIAQSTTTVPAGASPSQALTTDMGPFIFGANFLGGTLESLRFNRQGKFTARQLLQLPDSEFVGNDAPHAPLGLALHPKEWLLYVGLPTASKLAVYKFNSHGKLSFVRAVPNSGKAICWVRVNKAGTRLYTSNSADHTLSVYDIATSAEEPREIQKIALNGVGAPFQLMIDPSGNELYVVAERDAATVPAGMGNEIHMLKINADGSLSQNDSALNIPLPGDTRVQGLIAL